MTDEQLRKELQELRERVTRLEQAPPYFMAIGASWALLWASFGAWWQRQNLWVPW